MRRFAGLVSGALSAATATARAEPVEVRVGSGVELDSNLYRVESSTQVPVAAPLLRVAGRAEKVWTGTTAVRLAPWASLRTSMDPTLRGEDVAIAAFDGHLLRSVRSRSLLVGGSVSYYDVIPLLAEHSRAFRNLSAAVDTSWLGGEDASATLSLGFRTVAYKPDRDFTWSGPTLAVRVQSTLWQRPDDTEMLELAADARSELRLYQGPALAWRCAPEAEFDPRCIGPTELERSDLHHAARLELIYTGQRIISGGYRISYNDSSSFGQRSLRHRLDLSLTTPLPGSIVASVTVSGQLDRFLDGLVVPTDVAQENFTTLGDDNRSSVHLRLARPLTTHWSVETQLSVWATVAGDAGTFRRALAYFGVAWNYQESEPQ